MDALRTVALLAATLTTGLMAGLFYAYSCSPCAARTPRCSSRSCSGSTGRWNTVRTWLCTVSFGSWCWALLQV